MSHGDLQVCRANDVLSVWPRLLHWWTLMTYSELMLSILPQLCSVLRMVAPGTRRPGQVPTGDSTAFLSFC